jgi:hypothetical protein
MAIEFQRSIFTTGIGLWQKCLSQNQERRLVTFQNLSIGNQMSLLPNAPGPVKDQFGTAFNLGLFLTFNQVLGLNWNMWGRAICEEWYVYNQFGADQLLIFEGINNG